MGALVIEFVLAIVYDIVIVPLLMLLVLPFIPILALFGKGSHGRKMKIYTARIWRRLKRGTFLPILDELFDRDHIPIPEKSDGQGRKSLI